MGAHSMIVYYIGVPLRDSPSRFLFEVPLYYIACYTIRYNIDYIICFSIYYMKYHIMCCLTYDDIYYTKT